MATVSTLGIQVQTINNLQSQQFTLALLNQQVATNKLFNNLTDYTPTAAHNLMDFQNAITQKRAYISTIQTVQARLKVYDTTMNDMEKIITQTQQLAAQNQNYDASKIPQIAAQVETYLKQIADDLNQKLGDRYIYAGTRYTTVPVVDLTALAIPTLPFTAETANSLPDYDTDYVAPGPTTSAPAWTQDSVTVDSGFTVTYGVTSTALGFQEMIAGLRVFADAVTQTNPATYQSELVTVGTLLGQAISHIQGLHAGVANNINILQTQLDNNTSDINSLLGQISDIQKVDLTEVGTKINILQTQLQASYSASANLTQLSILKFL